jgi:hypothetical protein
MFCGNCGTKTVEGNLFCVTCGRAQPPASPLKSIAGLVLEERRTPAEESIALKPVEGAPPMDVTARTGVSATQPGQEPLYCRHSRFQRTALGVDREHGSEICLGCKLPYLPGSPNSRTEGDIQERHSNVASGATQPGQEPLYCRHSRFQRTALGVDREHGSEICLGCKLPYSPGSPNSYTEGVAQERNCNVASGEKPVRRLPKVLVPIAAVALAFALAVGVGWAYGVSHRQGQQGSGDAQAAACARVATLNSQIEDIRKQETDAFNTGGGAPAYAPYARQWRVLAAELVVQNKVCKG